jgi:cytochrome c oxidase subunit 1
MHSFWIFGHPEVYVLVLPAFAFASEIIPVFSRKAIFGYSVMVLATIAIGFIGMSVWAHHMFTVGMSAGANTFFVLSTMAIAVPTGIKIFNWLATMWGGRIRFATPMLFCVASLFQFLVAGLTGVTLAVAPLDWQLGNSYYVVAHFHYVIVGGILFAFSPLSTTGCRKLPAGCAARHWARCISGFLLLAFTSRSISCMCPGCSACRGAFTLMSRAVGGISGI